jgi:hypothetical protein
MPTIGAGSVGPGVVVEGVKEVEYDFYAAWKMRKQRISGRFPALIDLKNAQKRQFCYLKVLKKIYSQDLF